MKEEDTMEVLYQEIERLNVELETLQKAYKKEKLVGQMEMALEGFLMGSNCKEMMADGISDIRRLALIDSFIDSALFVKDVFDDFISVSSFDALSDREKQFYQILLEADRLYESRKD